MCNEIRRIDFQLTAGELGALLLESDLIKRLKPVYNLRLRETTKRIALCLQEDNSMAIYTAELSLEKKRLMRCSHELLMI